MKMRCDKMLSFYFARWLFQPYELLFRPSFHASMMHPIILVTLSIITFYLLQIEKYQVYNVISVTVEVFYFLLPWLIFEFFYFFGDMRLIPLLSIFVPLLEFRTIPFGMPIFITSITLDLWHVSVLLKSFSRLPFLLCHRSICLSLFTWSNIVLRL